MRRITVTLLLVVLVAIFGLGVALDTLFERYNDDSDDDFTQIESIANGFAETLRNSPDPESIVSLWPQSTDASVAIEHRDNLPLPAALVPRFESGKAVILQSDDGVSLHYLLPKTQKVLSITTAHDAHNDNNGLAFIFTSLFYIGTLALVLLWLKPLLQRLNVLRTTAKSFGAGNLDSRVQRQGLSYIRDIETEFNAMADKIQLLIEDNKLLTSAVSHDLRTPLARLRFGLDTLTESDDPSAQARYAERINRDLDEMENLVNALLRYARLDNVMEGVEKRPVALRSLLSECSAQYYDSNLLIKIDHSRIKPDDDLIINGGIEHLATLLNNLIQNATEHASKKLIIELGRTRNTIEIAFCDDGPGIPEAMRERVLKPFQRGESTDTSNYGLGLAVVSRIARHHGGRVDISDCKNLGGARIAVVFTVPSTV